MMDNELILLAHGSGGRMSNDLIREVFQSRLGNPLLNAQLDSAVFPAESARIAMTTDSFVVTPVFFPGGDIGKLAVCGTVNDLAVAGAAPRYLSAGFIIEEGFPVADLIRVVESMQAAAQAAGVMIVTGDTKVVARGQADRLFINTTGVGFIPAGVDLKPTRIRPGDAIIVSGSLGEHGLAVLAQREGLKFTTQVRSDCAPVHELAKALLASPDAVRVMRDPTRGGLATTLNELALQGGQGMLIKEELLPIPPAVQGGCEFLGLDPLYLANEGKLVAVVDADYAEEAVAALRRLPAGGGARVIGQAAGEVPAGVVALETELGARRILPMLEGEPLPRIC